MSEEKEPAERREREAAWRRGAGRAEGERDPRAARAAREVANRAFTALAENVRDYAIFLIDPEGIITFWGEGARLIEWWTKEQAEGAHLRLLYPDGGAEDGTAEEHLREAAEKGEYTGEGSRVRSDGSTFWAGVTLTALRDDQGELIGFAKLARDLTAQRAADAALAAAHEAAERARTLAEEASQAKTAFLATMSHEIRTPLNAVMAYTDLLQMQLTGPLTEGQQVQLGKIRASSQHLLGIVEDVLDLSRVEAGRMVVNRQVLRAGPVVEGALALMAPQAEARGVEVVDAVSGDAARVAFWGDEERVRQVLVNLLGNAVKFTSSGGRITLSAGTTARPSLDVKVEGAGPWFFLRVEDTGPGIPRDRLVAIFEPFEQADMSLTRQHGGTGLGLPISRGLARLMGGDLTVRSEVGMGSTFLLWLPAAPLEQESPPDGAGMTGPDPTRALLLTEVRDAILAELERVLYAYVARLRSDLAHSAQGLDEAELEDHLASFLSDLAQTFATLDLSAGARGEMLRDGTAIQRTIAERHGVQRLRLGWSERDLVREHDILHEEIAAAVRRRIRRDRAGEVEEAIRALGEFLENAKRISLESYRRGAEGIED